MPAPKKRLADFIRDRSFLARRHAELLLTAPLVPDRGLRKLQERYREETSELERRQLALYFEKAVRDPELRAFNAIAVGLDATEALEGSGRRGGSARGGSAPRRLTGHEFLYAAIGPYEIGRDGEAFKRLTRRWLWWDGRHGLWWRLAHDCEHNGDLLKIHKLLTGKRTRQLDVAKATLDEHRPHVDELVAAREPIPDPPGLELVSAVQPTPRRGRRA